MKQAHIPILKSFDDFRFNLGIKTLADFLKGDVNATIEKNHLDELESYGCLYMLDKKDLFRIINWMIEKSLLEKQIVGGGFQVVVRTSNGLKEMYARDLEPFEVKSKVLRNGKLFDVSEVTSQDKKIFDAFDFFIKKYNDEQKKAIVSSAKSILCVAGAGSGKTTVLTKRIEFLVKFRSVKEKDILAITFTRKAKDEMQSRLKELGILNVKVETFNSFCERLLKRHGDKVYKKEVKVAQYRDKIAIVKSVMQRLSIHFDIFLDDYFNKTQIRQKTPDELFFIFVNDIFSVIDYYKNFDEEMKQFYQNAAGAQKKRVAKAVFDIAKMVDEKLKERGLRDFSDQIIDALKLLRENPELIRGYEHILVDEFQDVNKVQVDLLKILNPENIFAVGDPRQAIYGWRGSQIEYILDFPKIFENCEVIELKMNYRSKRQIVDFFNLSIKGLGLADLVSSADKDFEERIFLIEQDSELMERRFVLEAIKNSKAPRCEIFVLARTNKTLENFADFFTQNGVAYAIKSEEEYKDGEPKKDEIVLATVHSIKGMEASEVYVVGANTLNFPNKVVDNFVFALVKDDSDYDKQAEEERLFYVALSRAKDKLVITYTGNPSKFITSEMLKLISVKKKNKDLFSFGDKHKRLDNSNVGVLKLMIKDWRSQKAKESGLPAYMVISNAAIDDLVKLRPSSRVELHNVNGLGEVKIARYGDEILKIING